MSTSRKSTLSGFSLMELLVVVVIVGILASIAIPSFGNAVERSRCRDAQSTLNIIFQAERIFRLDNNTYGTLAELTGRGYMPTPSSNDWTYTTGVVTAATFIATATRTGGGGFNGRTIQIDERFTGASNPAYGGTVYLGNHPLHD